MTKLIWVSDLHFTKEGHVLGHDPRVRLKAAIDHINAHHSDAQMCMITGDMVNRGTSSDYEGLRAHLGKLSIPYFPMVGNHDSRSTLRQALPLPDTCLTDFVQYTCRIPNGLIVCLDTHKSGSDAGEFCQARRDWLLETLRDAGDTPVFLFLHHPPMPLGLPMQDTDRLEDGEGFLKLISKHDCVKYMFIGHVHRPMSGTVGGIPFSTMRSVLYQAPAPRPHWTWKTFKPSAEAPSIGVVELDGASVTLQYDQFCDHQTGVQDSQSNV